MREKPICDGVPLIAMPGCPKARCCVKPVKGHRGRGCREKPAKWSRVPEGGGDGKGRSQSWGVACLRQRETEAGG